MFRRISLRAVRKKGVGPANKLTNAASAWETRVRKAEQSSVPRSKSAQFAVKAQGKVAQSSSACLVAEGPIWCAVG